MATKSKTIKVEVPEIDTLPIDPIAAQQLDALCTEVRVVQGEIKDREKVKDEKMTALRPLAESLNLPERVLGSAWDLRRVVRASEKINGDRLKMHLLKLNIHFDVDCTKTVLTVIGTIEVCKNCNGTGRRYLDGLPAVNYLVDQCTDRSETVSWSVYGRESATEAAR